MTRACACPVKNAAYHTMHYSISSKTSKLLLAIAAVAVGSPGLSFAQAPADTGAGGITALTVAGGDPDALTFFQAPSYEAQDGALQRKMVGAPKIGEATAVYNISQSGNLLAWISRTWEGGPAAANTSVRLADQDYNIKRGIDMGACVITGIEWPELKASDGKKHFEVTAKWQPQNLKYIAGGGRLQPPGQPSGEEMLPSNFTVTMPGLPDEWIASVSLPKITPKIAKESHGKFSARTRVYDTPTLGALTIEIEPAGIEAASAMAVRILQDGNCEEAEFVDIVIDMKDQSMKKVLGTFTLIGCGLRKFDWAPQLEGGKEGLATATMEFRVEDFRFSIARK